MRIVVFVIVMLSIPDDPMGVFNLLKSPSSRRQNRERFKRFLEFLGLDVNEFMIKAKQNPDWTQNGLLGFISQHFERVKSGAIVASTVKNYYKSVKLFCDWNSIITVEANFSCHSAWTQGC
ncbi:MAG: hypothetical protein WA667_03355 [Candidatus Nitrosopolaris sp.]